MHHSMRRSAVALLALTVGAAACSDDADLDLEMVEPMENTRGVSTLLPLDDDVVMRVVNDTNQAIRQQGPYQLHTQGEFMLEEPISAEKTPERGVVTYPLWHGYLEPTGDRVYFVLSEVGDPLLADDLDTLWGRTLNDADMEGVEMGTRYDGSEFYFEQDPGRMAHYVTQEAGLETEWTEAMDSQLELVRPTPNDEYSPLKLVDWNGRMVFANLPFIKWGPDPSQQMIVDRGGCKANIRRNSPSPFFVPFGPADCERDDYPVPGFEEFPGFVRYRGGQLVDLQIPEECEAMGAPQPCGTVTMKLHKGQHRADVHPYYTVFEASKRPPAESMGVIYSPKMGKIGGFQETKASANIFQFGNGVDLQGLGGPNHFQPGLTAYGSPEWNNYTPMWHITFGFFDCDEDGVFYDREHNISFGATPAMGQAYDESFDPADPTTFDPWQMDDQGASCPEYCQKVTGNEEGFIDHGRLQDMIDKNVIVETEAPPGWTGEVFNDNPDLQRQLIVNCPTPVSWNRQ